MRNRWLGLIIAALILVAGLLAYTHLPPQMATHWNARGEIDGYSSRLVAVLVFPLVMLGIAAMFHLLPKIDPRGRNYARFNDTYWLIANGILVFLAVVQALLLANGLGLPLSMSRILPVGVGLLLMVIGNYLGRVQPNWFIGIRTPWTLSSDEIWRRTHRLGARLFVLCGLLFVVSAALPATLNAALVVAAVVVLALVPVLYSLWLWLREKSSTQAGR